MERILETSDYDYIGWIPCVSGHLDFGLTKVGIQGGFTDKRFKDVNVIQKNFSATDKGDSHHRKIILQSWVDWRDTETDDNAEDGKFRLFTAAEAFPSDVMSERELEGNTLIYPLYAEPEEVEDIKRMKLHSISHGINVENINSEFQKLNNVICNPAVETSLDKTAIRASLHFRIKANGIVYMKFNGSTSLLDSESKFIIARQVYYYLKYCIHSHRHHINDQDSLTTITQNNASAGMRLLCQLKRELTTLSRIIKLDNSTHPTNDARGIVAYSKSLTIALREEELLTPEESQIESERLENVKNSFAAMDNIISRDSDLSELVKSKSKVWLGFAIVFGWGISNFLFASEKMTIAGSTDSFLVPFGVLITCVVIYFLTGRYYRIKHTPADVEKIYYSRIRVLSLKVIGVAMAFATLGHFLLNSN